MKAITFTFLCLLIASAVFPQTVSLSLSKPVSPDEDKELKGIFKNLDGGVKIYKELMKGKTFDVTAALLEQRKSNPDDAYLNYLIGYVYLLSTDPNKSLAYLDKACKLDSKISSGMYYLLGYANQINEKFDEAIANYELYKKSAGNKDLTLVNKKILECKYGRDALKNQQSTTVNHAGNLNSNRDEYGILYSLLTEKFYFTSRRSTTTGGKLDKNDNQFCEDIYSVSKTGGQWSSSENKISINTEVNDALSGIAADGKKMIVFRGGKSAGDLYESEWLNGNWSTPVKLNKNVNTKYTESSAAFSPDGRLLYFCSDRPGGFGGMDIYKCERNEFNEWGPASNLGPQINSPFNEGSVYLTSDGKTLFFASEGFNSAGGYDIFKSVMANGKWSRPENLGYPVNTSSDEIYYCSFPDEKTALFSSNRPGGSGGMDIYELSYVQDTALLTFNVKGKDNEALQAAIKLFYADSASALADLTSDKQSGSAGIKVFPGYSFRFDVSAKGYLPYSGTLTIMRKEKEKEVMVYLQEDTSVQLPSETLLSQYKEYMKEPKFTFNNIYFDFDRFSLRPEAREELDNISGILSSNPQLKIEIGGHCDNIGSYAYNLTLSFKRAKSAYDYFVNKKSIEKERLAYKGYSFSQPAAPNTNPDGSDNPEGRKLNRRDEFVVIYGDDISMFDSPQEEQKTVEASSTSFPVEKASPKYYIIAGSFKNLVNAKKLAEELIAKGYEGTILESTTSGLYRVSYRSYPTKQEAENEIAEFNRTTGESPSWILIY